MRAFIWRRGRGCYLVQWIDHESGEESWEAHTTLAAAKRWVADAWVGKGPAWTQTRGSTWQGEEAP